MKKEVSTNRFDELYTSFTVCLIRYLQQGDVNVFREEWGERLVSKHHPVVCVVDIGSQTVSTLESVPEDISAGQAIWAPNDTGIVFVGHSHEPYRLGIIYCNNRRSTLFYADLKSGKCEALSVTDQWVELPHFSPDQTKLVYLRNEAVGPHRHCSQLVMYDWASNETVVVSDTVHKPTADNPFPGIYILLMSSPCKWWLSDSRRLVLSSAWGSKKEILLVNTATSSITRLTSDPCFGEWTVLDIMDDVILARRSSPNKSSQLVIGELPSEGQETSIAWIPLDAECHEIDNVSWEIMELKGLIYEESKYDAIHYEAILVTPGPALEASKPPLLVLPHGGPHSVIVAEYNMSVAAFCKLGFAVLLGEQMPFHYFVNVRASVSSPIKNDVYRHRPGITRRPWPWLPLVMALVPPQKFPIDLRVFKWKCPLQNENGLALSKMKFQACRQSYCSKIHIQKTSTVTVLELDS